MFHWYFSSHAEADGYYLEDDPEYDDEIDEEFEKFLLEQEAQQWFKTGEYTLIM